MGRGWPLRTRSPLLPEAYKGVLGFCGGGLFPERTIVEAAGTRALLSASNSGSLNESGEDLERPSDGGEMLDDLAMASPAHLIRS